MSIKALFALVLIGAINQSMVAPSSQSAEFVVVGKQQANNATTLPSLANRQQLMHTHENSSTQLAAPETLETSPTITSVHHQVWTSSSSGRLDELSPEVISKLRNDVPFLAAYALRPRLVGGPASTSAADIVAGVGGLQPIAADKLLAGAPYETSNRVGSALASTSIATPVAVSSSTNGMPLQVGASSPKAARQSLVPKLGDFSEFNVETSSSSKSEHHHKRRTSLKKPQKGHLSASRLSSRKRAVEVEDSLSQLVKKVKKAQRDKQGRTPTRRLRSSKKRNQSKSRARSSKSGKRRSASRRSRNRKGRSGKRRARLLQEQTDGGANDLGADTRSRTNDDGSSVKGGSTGGAGDVKGGSPSGSPKKPPFFANGQRPKQTNDKPGPGADETGGSQESEPNAIDSRASDAEIDDDDAEIDDEPRAEPRRVGDDDVEDEGDTVLVEPKSDGVDDDPPLPDSPEDIEPRDGTEATDDEDANERPATGSSPTVPENDARGNRVNRQKPNERPSGDGNSDSGENDNGDVDDDVGAGAGQVAGGGIGATTGSGVDASTPTGGRKNTGLDDSPTRDEAGKDESENDDRRRTGSSPRIKGDNESGVEFADEDERRNGDDVGRGGKGRSDDGFDEGTRTSDGRSPSSDGDFGERRKSDGSNVEHPTGAFGGNNEDDDDLDYRDEMDRSARMKPASTGGDKGSHHEDESSISGPSNPRNHSSTHGVHCDDGSYDHHGDHHGDHHHHHDTIDWLRGAIPGEPDDDYPILSRVNVTSFSCADQKHPGYYADVEARCQIFHICQADGRQDSFLCPNGTIFSQKSLVCVWWNGFHCEDAPKFYHLNELLYKTTNGNESPQAVALPNLRPLAEAHPMPRSMNAAADEGDSLDAKEDDSPIDGMTKATKRGRGAQETSFMESRANDGLGRGLNDGSKNIGPDDDATIQRKSTNLDDDSIDEPPARLRTSDHIPRRRRRASTRQAPPKLTSRRVSRNSRRRKLRHGKPRRRA